jgi:F0F1-type ATP synthase assembly protein I
MAFEAKLGREFGFDEADLAANRDGRLSDEQELIRRNTAAYTRRRAPRIRALLVIVFAVAIALVVYGATVAPGGSATGGIVGAVILAWVAGIVLFFMRKNRPYQEALDRGEILTVEGAVSFEPVAFDEGVGGATYHVFVDDKKYFTIFADQMDSLTDGGRYRFYYMDIAIGKAIYSLERAEG